MPRRLPPYVERNYVKGHTYLPFRRGKGARIRLPKDPTSPEFMWPTRPRCSVNRLPLRPQISTFAAGSIAAPIASYMRSSEYIGLRNNAGSPNAIGRFGKTIKNSKKIKAEKD
ncbi:MAG: putative phage integrase [Bradyrhizobium sp.]|nr:putative phage integrase [Bradyrhizobium sp.]